MGIFRTRKINNFMVAREKKRKKSNEMKLKKGLTNRKRYDAILADLLNVTLDNQTRKRGNE